MRQQSPVAAVGSSGGGSKLFEGLAGVTAASLFGSPPPAAPPAAGPFGGQAGDSGAEQQATAPVFGLQVGFGVAEHVVSAKCSELPSWQGGGVSLGNRRLRLSVRHRWHPWVHSRG
jgi:hypothetical protein